MTGKLISRLSEKYPLTECSAGEYAKMKVSGMTFNIKCYKAEGLGHISVMTANGFLGLMRMDTLIINPTELDLPLYSYDRIYAMGNDTLIVELYDTLEGNIDMSALQKAKERYADLPERDAGEHWYDSIKLSESISKKAKTKLSSRLDEMAEAHFAAYIGLPADRTADVLSKQKKASVYVEGLLEKGGPSTDVFVKSIGRESTARLYRSILFGTSE